MQVSTMYILIADTLIIVGGGILIRVLFIIQRLFSRLPSGKIRSKKYFLTVPVLFFILAYLGCLFAFWNTQTNWHDLIVPGILFASACSLWLIYKLSLQPTIDFLLEHGNITDPLMGINNRRYLERRLNDEVARAHRYSMPLSVFLLDIDQLKNINATYSHQVGDQVLVHLGKLLQEYLRESDEVARYDRDEILVMTPNTSIQDVQLLAERIRQRVVAQPLLLHARTEKEKRVAFNISIGVATLHGGFDSMDKLLQRTDAALQQARQAGGNRVVISEADVTEIKTSQINS